MIGGGVVGAAAALAVARAGTSVTVLERSVGAAAEGSSKGVARIFAPAAYPDDSYLEAALRGLDGWRAIERRCGKHLLWPTGALSYGEFAERELPALRAAGLDAERLAPRDAEGRFGVSFPEGSTLIHQPDAGVIRADRALACLRDLARAAGAEIHPGEAALSIAEASDEVVVETSRGSRGCSAAIVAAGPWSGPLLGEAGFGAALEVSLQAVAHFDLTDPAAEPVTVIEFEDDEPFACWDHEGGLKAGFHARGPAVDPDRAPGDDDGQAIERLSQWVRSRYGDLVAPEPSRVVPCMYTNAPGERFVIERRGRIVAGSACNGQGFQFAPDTGERLARLALETEAPAGATAGVAR